MMGLLSAPTLWPLFRRFWWAIPVGLLMISNVALRHRLSEARGAVSAERAAHATTITNMQAARAEAARLDATNMVRVQAEQAAINRSIEDDYQVHIAALRARFERLRANSAARGGGGRGATMSGISDTTSGADGAAGQDRLSAGLTPSTASRSPSPDGGGLSDDDALIASEQALQLEALQAWVRAQSAVNINQANAPEEEETGP